MSELINKTTKKLSNSEKREKVLMLLDSGCNLKKRRSKFEDAEKTLQKACRIMENVYRQTFSNKDRSLLLECYFQIKDFYQNCVVNKDLLQRWHQKIVGVYEESCDKFFSLDEYHLLLEWYINTIDLMIENSDYNHVVLYGNRMHKRANSLYNKTKTNEDKKFVILSMIFLGIGYSNQNKKYYGYYFYRQAAKEMEVIYKKYNDLGMKNDLISLYTTLVKLSENGILKLFNKKWTVKLGLLKGE